MRPTPEPTLQNTYRMSICDVVLYVGTAMGLAILFMPLLGLR